MKKLLEVFILLFVMAWTAFSLLVLNPQWSISQQLLPMFNIEKVLSIDEVPSLLSPQMTGIDLTNCVSYFDGCNHCSVRDGKADACTLMYCETPSEPKCLEYARTEE